MLRLLNKDFGRNERGVFMQVKDLMQSEVTCLKPSTTLAQAWKSFSNKKISGAPVVDHEDKLVGVISQTDLVKEAFSKNHSHYPQNSFFVEFPYWSSVALEGELDDLDMILVSQRMVADVVTVSPTDPISSAAGKMRSLGIHRLIVTDNNSVVGILSSFDLLQVLENHDSSI